MIWKQNKNSRTKGQSEDGSRLTMADIVDAVKVLVSLLIKHVLARGLHDLQGIGLEEEST